MYYPNNSIDEDIYLFILSREKAGRASVWFEEIARQFQGVWFVPDIVKTLDTMEERGIIKQSAMKTNFALVQ